MSYTMDAIEAEDEKEKARMFISFLSNFYAQQPMGKDQKFEQGRQKFIESIQPKTPKKAAGPAKVYQWDEELMKRLAAQQKGG